MARKKTTEAPVVPETPAAEAVPVVPETPAAEAAPVVPETPAVTLDPGKPVLVKANGKDFKVSFDYYLTNQHKLKVIGQ